MLPWWLRCHNDLIPANCIDVDGEVRVPCNTGCFPSRHTIHCAVALRRCIASLHYVVALHRCITSLHCTVALRRCIASSHCGIGIVLRHWHCVAALALCCGIDIVLRHCIAALLHAIASLHCAIALRHCVAAFYCVIASFHCFTSVIDSLHLGLPDRLGVGGSL